MPPASFLRSALIPKEPIRSSCYLSALLPPLFPLNACRGERCGGLGAAPAPLLTLFFTHEFFYRAENPDAGNNDAEPAQEQDAPSSEESEQKTEDLTAKIKAAEEKVQFLEAELEKARQEQLQPIEIIPTPDNPFANANSPEQLNQEIEKAQKLWRWVSENPEGTTYRTADGQEVEITPEQMRKMRLDTEEAIQFHAPRRAAYLEQKAQYDAQAKEAYPDLFKTGSPQSIELNKLASQWPEVTRFSDCNLFLGDYLAGRKLREEQVKKTSEDQKKPVAKTKLPLAPPVPNSRGGSQFADSSKSTLKKAEQKFFASDGDSDSLADLLYPSG